MTKDDLAALRSWIGRSWEAEDVVTRRLVDSLRATLHPWVGPDEVPPGLHWCLAPDILDRTQLGQDGHPKTGILMPPVPLPRRMWAGSDIRAGSPFGIGERVRRRSTIESIDLKSGRSGPLCFVTVGHSFQGDRGGALDETQTVVYRAPASEAPSTRGSPEPARDAPHRRDVDVDPVMLFRYSALTFNGHRIHYDAPYAIGEEHYAGLVIHGPLQATLLLILATDILKRPVRRFAFKGVAPAVGPQRLGLLAAPGQDGGLDLTCVNAEGHVTTVATAA